MKKAYTPNINSSKGKDLTKYVSKFIYQTKFKDIPSNVVELKKTYFRWFWISFIRFCCKNR